MVTENLHPHSNTASAMRKAALDKHRTGNDSNPRRNHAHISTLPTVVVQCLEHWRTNKASRTRTKTCRANCSTLNNYNKTDDLFAVPLLILTAMFGVNCFISKIVCLEKQSYLDGVLAFSHEVDEQFTLKTPHICLPSTEHSSHLTFKIDLDGFVSITFSFAMDILIFLTDFLAYNGLNKLL